MSKTLSKKINYNKHEDSLLSSFIFYLLKPEYIRPKSGKHFIKIAWDVFRLWSLGIIITAILGFILAWLIGYFNYDQSQHSVVELFANESTLIIILLAFVWAPLIEEFTFRMGLFYSPFRLSFSLVLLFGTFTGVTLTFLNNYFPISAQLISFIAQPSGLAFTIILALVSGYLLGRIIKNKLSLKLANNYYAKHFGLIFYLAAFSFAIVHAFNFFTLRDIWFLLPLLIAPQLIMGILFGYIRMRYGLIWSIFNHFLHNMLLTAPFLILGLAIQNPFGLGDGEVINELAVFSINKLLFLLIFLWFITILLLGIIIAMISLWREYYKNY